MVSCLDGSSSIQYCSHDYSFRHCLVLDAKPSFTTWRCLHCDEPHSLSSKVYKMKFSTIFMIRFILTLHFSSHRKIFPKNSPLNWVAPYVFSPLFGMPGGLYY